MPLFYGWDADMLAYTGGSSSPDLRQNSFISMQPGGVSHSWSIALPSGNYVVHISAGDSGNTSSGYYDILADGVSVVSGRTDLLDPLLPGHADCRRYRWPVDDLQWFWTR